MKYDLFELNVAVPGNNKTTLIPEYGHNGLTFVSGRRGQRYSLKLRNNSAGRVLAVISIDGLNVLDGAVCTPESRGYVLPAYSSVEIDGWRTNLARVNEFTFTEKSGSYAAGSGNGVQNCGVIAAKIFSEFWAAPAVSIWTHNSWPPVPVPLQPAYPAYPVYPGLFYVTTSTTNQEPPSFSHSAPGSVCQYSNNLGYASQAHCNGPSPEFKLGTGWGNERESVVSETSFVRNLELCTLTVYYAEAADLVRAGVRLNKKPEVTPPAAPVLPQAFTKFCTPPSRRT